MNSFEFKGKTYDDLISVIIPVYKLFDSTRVRMSLDSLLRQRSVNIEVIIAEQSDEPKFEGLDGVLYVFVPNKERGNSSIAVPGLVRNRAAEKSSGKYLYNSDGDIVFTNPYYFAEILELIKTGEGIALCRPPMRRLPLEDFSAFKTLWERFGLGEALARLDFPDKFTANVPGSNIRMLSFRKKESGRLKTFLYSSSDFKEYNENLELKGSEPKYSTLSVHAGATFVEREQFRAVGGFCQRFLAWGCHDADLQWKLRSRFNMLNLPDSPEYEVLHLDHPRGYFNRQIWAANRSIQQLRRGAGVDAAILEDLKSG